MIKMEDLRMLHGEMTTPSVRFSRKEKNPLAVGFLLPLQIYGIPSRSLFIVLITHKN